MEATARALGAYYTPKPMASTLVRWAVRHPTDRVFDPGCGEGVFLGEAVSRLLDLGTPARRLPDQIAGVELDSRAMARANGVLLSRHPSLRWGRLAEGDFFAFAAQHLGTVTFDVALGNPPYLRTQGRDAVAKRFALSVAKKAGVELTGDASLWAPYVACAAGFVRPGGRLAMVIPREALFVRYAKPLLRHLEERFADVRIVALDDLHFDALQKVALLLCEGQGPGVLRLHESSTLADLDLEHLPPPVRSFVAARIPEDCRDSVERALASPALVPMSEIANVQIGIVTGESDFFLLEPERARVPGRFLTPAVAKPQQLPGSVFWPQDLLAIPRRLLLAVPPEYAGGCDALDAYLREGETAGIPGNYKCRTRKPWYAVRRVGMPPDAFLGYCLKRRFRAAANFANANSTNNVHRVYLRSDLKRDASRLVASWMNAVTAVSAELLGRVHSGGVLKIEPGEAARLLVPDPAALRYVPVERIDRALRADDELAAWELADRVACRALGLQPGDVSRVRRAHAALREARLTPPASRASAPASSPRS